MRSLAQKLSEYLAIDFNVNYWSDDAVDYATHLVNSFGDADWAALSRMIKIQSSNWQSRLADTLATVETTEAQAVLAELILSGNSLAGLRAAEALSIQESWTPTPVQKTALKRLWMIHFPSEGPLFETLLAR